jgi:hypothetical protein
LLTFAYYLSALSYKPQLYNRYAVLALEIQGTIYWMISMVLLAEWASNSNNGERRQARNNVSRTMTSPNTTSSARRWSLVARGPGSGTGLVYDATVKLAGISAGLAGLEL